MDTLQLVDGIDFDVFYEAEMVCYPPEYRERLVKAGFTAERCRQMAEGWPTLGLVRNGKQIGGVIFDPHGTWGDAHLSVLAGNEAVWARTYDAMLDWLFSHKDPVFVKVEHFCVRSIRFLSRQWECVDRDERSVTFRLSSAERKTSEERRARRNKCLELKPAKASSQV